jgi:trigger factor
MREMDRETFIDQEVKPAATRRLERSLVLEEFARRENVEVKSEEIQSIYYGAMQQMQSQEARQVQSKNKRNTQEMANSIAINTVNSIFNQRMMNRLKAIATGKGDEPEIFETAVVEGETDNTEADEAEQVIAPESEAALESVEASPIIGETQAEEELAAAEDDLLTEEPPQADEETGESEA